jgi:hypothetical protein
MFLLSATISMKELWRNIFIDQGQLTRTHMAMC